MKRLSLLATACLLSLAVSAQKLPVYAEVGGGFGQTLFFSGIKDALRSSLGGAFNPGTGNNIAMAFYLAPDSWHGLGLGSRIKGTFGASVKGDGDDDYIFNYYNLGLSAKYFVGGSFNRGFYARAGVGFGQITTKRLREEDKRYLHQYALGTTGLLGLGYVFPVGKRNQGIGVEAELEASSRTGTVDGVGDKTFRSGQLGVGVYYSF